MLQGSKQWSLLSMTSKLSGEGDAEAEAADVKKALQFSAINSDF